MKDKLSVIKINGISGIILGIFLIGCMVEGLIVFPAWVLMHIWNYISVYFITMPKMELLHGSILWAIIVLSVIALSKGKSPISYSSSPAFINEEELKNMIINNAQQITDIEKINQIRDLSQQCTELKQDKTENKDTEINKTGV